MISRPRLVDRDNMEEKTQSDDAIEMSEAESDREGLTAQNNKEKGIDLNNRAVGEKDNVVCNKEDTFQRNKKMVKREIYENHNGSLKKLSETDASENILLKKERYEDKEAGPYKVLVRLDKEKANTRRSKNVIIIIKTLIKNDIRPADILMSSFLTAEVKFVSQADANQCLDYLKNRKEETGLCASIDFRTSYSKGVVSDWPDSIEDLREVMSDHKDIAKIERMYKKK